MGGEFESLLQGLERWVSAAPPWDVGAARIGFGLLVVLGLGLLWVLVWKPVCRRWRVEYSRKVLKRFRAPGFADAQRIAYLRRIDPFVFEELLLTALETRGYRVVRSPRYTGDGGVDGRFYWGKELVLIQAKRYGGHINLEHVRAFQKVVADTKQARRGLFVHTGRTGRGVWERARGSEVAIISGQKLLALLDGVEVRVGGDVLRAEL